MCDDLLHSNGNALAKNYYKRLRSTYNLSLLLVEVEGSQ